MNILFTVTYYLFVIHLVRVIIQWLHLWQVKEYRLDRMMVHFKETRQGKNIFFGVEPLVKIGIIINSTRILGRIRKRGNKFHITRIIS